MKSQKVTYDEESRVAKISNHIVRMSVLNFVWCAIFTLLPITIVARGAKKWLVRSFATDYTGVENGMLLYSQWIKSLAFILSLVWLAFSRIFYKKFTVAIWYMWGKNVIRKYDHRKRRNFPTENDCPKGAKSNPLSSF